MVTNLVKKSRKKGVSPLIATVILIAFSVALGAIIVTWGNNLISGQTKDVTKRTDRSIKCSLDLPIRILEVNDEKFICYNRSSSMNLEFIIENQGSASAEGVRVFLLDSNEDTKTVDIIVPLGSHNNTKYNVSINNTDNGLGFSLPPTKILISPILVASGSIDVCSDNRIDIEEIEECT
jgi:flagellin-like protein